MRPSCSYLPPHGIAPSISAVSCTPYVCLRPPPGPLSVVLCWNYIPLTSPPNDEHSSYRARRLLTHIYVRREYTTLRGLCLGCILPGNDGDDSVEQPRRISQRQTFQPQGCTPSHSVLNGLMTSVKDHTTVPVFVHALLCASAWPASTRRQTWCMGPDPVRASC